MLTLDNATSNKSNGMFATLGFILERLPHLENIYLLYCSVGHTHNELDGHFGTMTVNVLNKQDLLTPQG